MTGRGKRDYFPSHPSLPAMCKTAHYRRSGTPHVQNCSHAQVAPHNLCWSVDSGENLSAWQICGDYSRLVPTATYCVSKWNMPATSRIAAQSSTASTVKFAGRQPDITLRRTSISRFSQTSACVPRADHQLVGGRTASSGGEAVRPVAHRRRGHGASARVKGERSWMQG